MTEEMRRYAENTQEELADLIRTLAPIPAPSRQEDLRAAWVRDYLISHGAEGVFTDEMKNVIWPYNDTGENDLLVIMAHTDVVFPDLSPLPFGEDEDYFYCPGVSDDTASVAELLLAARFFIERKRPAKCGILIVANACEEGLGNSLGAQTILKNYGSRVKRFISVDGGLGTVVNRAVGSHRYEITVRTEGGHSWGNPDRTNAILVLSALLTDLYAIPLPEKENSRTTRNVGTIAGGTSVNTVAQEAKCLFEYRSDDAENLAYMQKAFEKTVAAHRTEKAEITVSTVGLRPCGANTDQNGQRALEELADEATRASGGRPLIYCSGSTDANFPLSLGIPAITVGSTRSSGTHTREEKLAKNSLLPGLSYLIALLSQFFD